MTDATFFMDPIDSSLNMKYTVVCTNIGTFVWLISAGRRLKGYVGTYRKSIRLYERGRKRYNFHMRGALKFSIKKMRFWILLSIDITNMIYVLYNAKIALKWFRNIFRYIKNLNDISTNEEQFETNINLWANTLDR